MWMGKWIGERELKGKKKGIADPPQFIIYRGEIARDHQVFADREGPGLRSDQQGEGEQLTLFSTLDGEQMHAPSMS